VSLLQRPKILKRLTESSKTLLEDYPDSVLTNPSGDLVRAINQLIEIVTLCAKCLLQFSPRLLNLMCDIEFQPNKWTPFVEVQFGVPKMNAVDFPQLSYGTVLSAVSLLIKTLNLQQHTFRQTPLNKLPSGYEADDGDTVSMLTVSETAHQRALAVPPMTGPTTPSSPRVTFAKSLSITSSVGGNVVQASNELLSHLDSRVCLVALEFLLTLLASQSLLALKDRHLSSREKQLIRRELSTELYCLHDFVKKKILKDSSRSSLLRPKFGVSPIVNQVDEMDFEETQPSSSSSRSASQRKSSDLRVNVVRKLHLQQKFEIPSGLSPIASGSEAQQSKDDVPIDDTPIRGSSKPTTSTSVKRVGFDLSSQRGNKVTLYEEDDEPYVVNRGDPSFTGLSHVKIIEEDYLHLLSNIFLFICQNEN